MKKSCMARIRKYTSHRCKNMYFVPNFGRISASWLCKKTEKFIHSLKIWWYSYIYRYFVGFLNMFWYFGLFIRALWAYRYQRHEVYYQDNEKYVDCTISLLWKTPWIPYYHISTMENSLNSGPPNLCTAKVNTAKSCYYALELHIGMSIH